MLAGRYTPWEWLVWLIPLGLLLYFSGDSHFAVGLVAGWLFGAFPGWVSYRRARGIK